MTDLNRTILPIPAAPLSSPTVDMRDRAPYPVNERPKPPAGAPNVLVVIVDDMGFGAPSAFGGPCRMPVADRLADNGLRYTRFHTTAICAPTRTSLLTGRNHHAVGMGTVPEMGTSAPGYNGICPDDVSTLPQILRGNGYHTGAFGKMHQTPLWELGETGPFDRWPLHQGFDRFYGLIGGETNQYFPNLVDGFTPIDPPKTPEEGYHFSEDIVDQAITWINSVSSLDPERPWFTYLSFGATHAPLHVPEEWRGRHRGEFAHGWDAQRELTLTRQKELGVVPADATLPDFEHEVAAWESLDADEKLISERLMELYADFAEHMDAQVGRLVDELESLGQLDNTLIWYILGDNGAAAEGGPVGTTNHNAVINARPIPAAEMVAELDKLGGPDSYPHYPVGWALAMNTPYQQSKTYASHFGGTRNGMVVHWPRGIAERGGLRHQWHHVIDVTPTVLEAAQIPAPAFVDGIQQAPIDGTSLHYTFSNPDAAEQHTRQYFEIQGSRGIYLDGWTAVTRHKPPLLSPWTVRMPDLRDDVWELYDIRSDWTQAIDLAAEHPERLARMKEEFLVDAARYNVLPIDDRIGERMQAALAPRPDLMQGRTRITLRPGMRGLREYAAPNLKNTSWVITAEVTVSEAGGDGVLVAQGGRFSGWSLYVHEGRPVLCYNFAGQRTFVRGAEKLPAGQHQIEARFSYDGGGHGLGGDLGLLVDGEHVAEGRLEATIRNLFSLDETLDVGCDRGSPVADDYANHPRDNRYRDRLHQVTIAVGDDQVAADQAGTARAIMSAH